MITKKSHRAVLDMVLFAILGAVLFAGKVAFEALPNIHPVTMLIIVYAVVFREKAFIPVGIFVAISGVFYGFSIWWLPQIYVWFVFVALTLTIPKSIKPALAAVVYPVVCGMFGLIYGTLYAPGQALLFGYSFSQMMKWIASGLPFDALHAAGNIGFGLLVLPLSALMKKLYRGLHEARE